MTEEKSIFQAKVVLICLLVGFFIVVFSAISHAENTKNPTPLVEFKKCQGLRSMGFCCPMHWTVKTCVERRNEWLAEKNEAAGRAVGRAVRETEKISSRFFEGLRKTLEEGK